MYCIITVLWLLLLFSASEVIAYSVCRDAYILRREITVLKQILYVLTQITNKIVLACRRRPIIAKGDYWLQHVCVYLPFRPSVCLSVFPSACNNSAATFHDIWYLNIFRKCRENSSFNNIWQ
jgi:hypothetical protein